MRHTHLKHLARREQSAWTRQLHPEHIRISPNSFSPQHPQEGSANVGVKKPTALVVGGCRSLAEGGGGASSSASAALRSVKRKHQPFLVQPC